MKLNLGCGEDIKPGYTNVDFRDLPGVQKTDLSRFPWPWPDSSADEILMLDFLEHFPYRKTDLILGEAWRVLKPGSPLVVQVPSFKECSAAMNFDVGMLCNSCGFEWTESYCMSNEKEKCGKCGQSRDVVCEAAMQRLYGGQDYEGNSHFAAFTQNSIQHKLKKNGFGSAEILETNENGETFRQNWNMRVRVIKEPDLWGEQ